MLPKDIQLRILHQPDILLPFDIDNDSYSLKFGDLVGKVMGFKATEVNYKYY